MNSALQEMPTRQPMQIQKACAEYEPTEGFPETFYKEVVSKVILYRDTHIEFKLQNGQIV